MTALNQKQTFAMQNIMSACGRRSTCHFWTLRIVGITMNQNVPFIWRVNYRNKAASPETFLEIAHERARQYLRKNLSRMPVHKAV